MTIDDMFGDTLFERATSGITKRVIMIGAATATKDLIERFKELDDGIDFLQDMDSDDPDFVGLLKEAFTDINKANGELIALSNMLEKQMGISA